MKGIVFMSYARADKDRVRPLVDHLSNQGIAVWWDEGIEPGERFRDAIDTALQKASCVIVAWSHASIARDFVRSESSRAMERGVLIPVLLDEGPAIPIPFDELQHVDLSEGIADRAKALENLVSKVRTFVDRKTYGSGLGPLVGNEWVVDGARRATSELGDLVSGIESLGEVLVSDSKPAADVKGSLEEVDKTFRVVAKAISEFVSPALGPGPIDPQPYVGMERGVLSSDIENGRGHCLKILMHYRRAHGLRAWLKPRLQEAELGELDRIFERLSTADGDLFVQMSQIGQVLTNEARVIVNLLLGGQQEAARKRIVEGREKLAPLEEDLRTAQMKLSRLATSLGFTLS